MPAEDSSKVSWGSGRQSRAVVGQSVPDQDWGVLRGRRLVAIAYVPRVLSAIYCYYDPTETARSLGTFNIRSMLVGARERGLPYVYLHYYVAGCRSMEYKRRFRPNEVLQRDGMWEVFDPQ